MHKTRALIVFLYCFSCLSLAISYQNDEFMNGTIYSVLLEKTWLLLNRML